MVASFQRMCGFYIQNESPPKPLSGHFQCFCFFLILPDFGTLYLRFCPDQAETVLSFHEPNLAKTSTSSVHVSFIARTKTRYVPSAGAPGHLPLDGNLCAKILRANKPMALCLTLFRARR